MPEPEEEPEEETAVPAEVDEESVETAPETPSVADDAGKIIGGEDNGQMDVDEPSLFDENSLSLF